MLDIPVTPGNIPAMAGIYTQWFSGAALRDARRRAGLSQQMLAQAADISQNHISQIEAGGRQPSPPVAARLAEAAGVRIADLLSDQPAEHRGGGR